MTDQKRGEITQAMVESVVRNPDRMTNAETIGVYVKKFGNYDVAVVAHKIVDFGGELAFQIISREWLLEPDVAKLELN